ncbi:sugar transporter SWEET1-like isoform X2 [Pomacea canaliculata]|uniref:sugar transporter SWEET1-like isoform X2 n=1 Tax=Pomacea canaliculata TaxID=400727 RepID=UPI000D725829|nr:sugar transporter SWEET1-like isoform X2 [Pomacea canaliculata]XP_025093654.1 sugar transporter SWEET1-like isoform X2 [Pomacea canaliculata]XP_025093655.1 sugar transporter SWEET1-like isoform X2 [Pomacea canaliculata]XP_025093656.1 sugar transporter SWEET1-like isoform X2 [Pomacea canaliculata]
MELEGFGWTLGFRFFHPLSAGWNTAMCADNKKRGNRSHVTSTIHSIFRWSHFYRLLTVGAVILFLPLIYVQYFENDPAVGVHHLGLVCCCMSVCCTGSPLATLRDVLRTKSTESMSFLLCFFNFVAALAWFVYGLLLKDSFIIIPNIIGGILGLTQVILFCIYPTSLVLQKPTDAVLTI